MDRVELSTSIPFHIAHARAANPAKAVGPVPPVRAVTGAETAPLTFVAPAHRMTGAAKLSAGLVKGRIDFTVGDDPVPGTLQMYRHPADKNAAATLVLAGRRVDVVG